MIRSIKKLREERPETIALKVLERLEAHPSYQSLVRFTWGEIENLLSHQHRLQAQSDSVFMQWRSLLTQAETNILDMLPRISPEGKKMGELRRRHTTSVERTTRYIEDLTNVVMKEERLRDSFEKIQSARSKVGMGDADTLKHIEHRFRNNNDGRGDIRTS